jgi:sugar phosphate permease
MPLFLGQELGYTKQQQANVLSLYEVGVVIGAIILGGTSDYFYSRRSPVGMFSIVLSSIFCFTIAFNYKNFSETGFTVSLFFLGFFVGSLHHLIVISAAADIGREQIGKRATSTVTGIIDGIGTSGSGLGQVILGKTIQSFGWFYGYILFIAIVITLAAVPMSRVLVREIGEIRDIRRQKKEAQLQ